MISFFQGNQAEAKKVRIASAPPILESEQEKIIKEEVMKFLRENPDRKAGEGWLFLARHYNELGLPDKSMNLIKNLVRAVPVEPELKYEAQLLLIDILKEKKEFDSALKELDRLFSWEPAREFLIRGKIARAKIIGRGMTKLDDLFKAYKRFYSKFPDANEEEELNYIIGFERGYDLETGMKGLETWEEISAFPEKESGDLGKLNVGLIYAFDLNKPEKGLEFLEKISVPFTSETATNSLFIRAALTHFHIRASRKESSEALYQEFRATTKDLQGYRISTIMLGNLLADDLNIPQSAIELFESLATTPSNLVATRSPSLKKRQEIEEEDRSWAVLGLKMAGYAAEYKLNDPDKAKYFYERAVEVDKKRFLSEPDFWLINALARTAPKNPKSQILFEKAYEKYRAREIDSALEMFQNFIASYPDHPMAREAKYRVAVITDDDLKDYDKALELYQKYVINVIPLKSAWKLDKLYDWGRSDEVRYRIGNLLALHRKDTVGALKIFDDLLSTYPDSYWASQGLKDTIKIQEDILGDENSAQESMRKYIKLFPESKEAQEYRKDLFKRLLSQKKNTDALNMLRDYLDHSLPSEKDYLDLKHQWRSLSYKIREDGIKERLAEVGSLDRVELLEQMIPVLSMATGPEPLIAFAGEIEKDETIPDEVRWKLTYKIGTQIYFDQPGRAKSFFEKLADTSTGTVKLACLLTLGNISFRVEKSVNEALRYYEAAASLTSSLNPWMETPSYRLGRIYLALGEGIKGLTALELFTRRFPHSRHIPKSFLTMGEAYLALHHPDQAQRYISRAVRLSPKLGPKAKLLLEQLPNTDNPDQWLAKRLREHRYATTKESILSAGRLKTGISGASGPKSEAGQVIVASTSVQAYEIYPPEELYEHYLAALSKPKPDSATTVPMLVSILHRDAPPKITEKAVRHLISWQLFRVPNYSDFTKEVQEILTRKNYPESFSELLYRLAMTKHLFQKDYEKANKSYFEYLSFYSGGKRVLKTRESIPQVYEKAKDTKNALRFYSKLIEDSQIPAESKVEASIRKAKIEEIDQDKDEAIKTLEASLAYESPRKPEILLRLEKLTENFDYVQKALDSPGDEKPRFIALKRLINKAEEKQEFPKAAKILNQYKSGFKEPEAKNWIEKKSRDLDKRGSITEIENKIEMFPDEPETPSRLFKLANLVEGVDNTKYRSEDLFYEITLVYPHSEFFKESKIRAENVRAIKAINEMSEVFKSGVKGGEGDELLLERARLYREALQAPTKAFEDYEALLKLFPGSQRRDEAYLGMGELALSLDKDAHKALELWETGLVWCRDPRMRQELTKHINELKLFQEHVLYSEKREDHENGENILYSIWRLENDPARALGLVQEALGKIGNRPQFARFSYFAGRVHETEKRFTDALFYYEKALRSLYHPGCRKDRLLYRMARINIHQGRKGEGYKLFVALLTRYPKSLFCRSALYWLYKADLEAKKLTLAHHRLSNLLEFRAIAPVHRKVLTDLKKDLTARMNVEEMHRLQAYSQYSDGSTIHYYTAKILANDLQDFDQAIAEYEKVLATNPPLPKARELLKKMADLAMRKGDFIRTAAYLDNLLKTMKPSLENLDLIIKIGDILEDNIGNQDLANLFYENVAAEYVGVKEVRNFARSKIKRIREKRLAKAAKPKAVKKAKREYTDEDQEILDQLDELKAKYIDDLQDFTKAEREMVALWDENSQSPATIEIMKSLVSLNEDQLLDPQKAAEYYERWLSENPDDFEYSETVMNLYELYMEKVQDGQKALRLLDKFINENPNSPLVMDAQIKLGKANELLVRNWDEARRIYQRIIDTKRNEPVVHEAYYRIGYVLREGFADYTSAVKTWEEMNSLFYNNVFAADAQFAIGYTYEVYLRDYTKAKENYEKILNLYPNSPLQNQVREALLRISGKQ